MKKYIIKSITKVDVSKAILEYTRGNKEVKTSRAIYNTDGYEAVLFKGIKLAVTFKGNVAVDIQVKEIYDQKTKAEDPNRLDNISLEIQNKHSEVQTPVKPVVAPKIPLSKDGMVKHMEFEWIKLNVEENNPVYLYGPAGSGKNHVLEQIAKELGLDFYFTNSVQQEFKITGFIDAGGKFHTTEFYNAWVKGGLFFLDEMDASIPEVLTLLNAALANKYFEFPGQGRINAHPDFRVVAAGNTVGTGADEQYTGRMQLDQATLDRFLFIEFKYDRNIELSIAKGNIELVDFIRSLRQQAEEQGINTTFSYRCIQMVVKLEGKADLKKIIQSAVVKGLDKDTIRTFKTTSTNKYSKALWEIAQAK